MSRRLALLGLAVFGVLLMAATGVKPPEPVVQMRLKGSPVLLGVITGNAASKTNASTATPFTIPSADVIDIVCDVAAFCIEGASVSATYAAATIGVPQALGVDRFWVLKASATATTTIACFAAGAYNCEVFEMQ